MSPRGSSFEKGQGFLSIKSRAARVRVFGSQGDWFASSVAISKRATGTSARSAPDSGFHAGPSRRAKRLTRIIGNSQTVPVLCRGLVWEGLATVVDPTRKTFKWLGFLVVRWRRRRPEKACEASALTGLSYASTASLELSRRGHGVASPTSLLRSLRISRDAPARTS